MPSRVVEYAFKGVTVLTGSIVLEEIASYGDMIIKIISSITQILIALLTIKKIYNENRSNKKE